MIKKVVLKIITLVLISTILFVGCSNNTASSPGSTKNDNKDMQSKISKYIEDFATKNEFSGTILVAKDGEVLLEKGYGMADYDKKVANKPETVFEIASLTKQFTATAILMLQEKKLLSVQDTIDKYIPGYPEGDKIKIYNLLNHTSGIKEISFLLESAESDNHIYTSKELVDIIKSKSRNSETGTSFLYSNANYTLLGYIIEKASGMSYEEYIKNNIFIPLNLNSTGFLSNFDNIKDKANGYFKASDKYTKVTQEENSILYAERDIYSTVGDLFVWENALHGEKLINKKSLNEMLAPYLGDYGYGWYIKKTSAGDKLIYHNGHLGGYSTSIEKNIDKRYTIIILNNISSDEYNMNHMLSGISDILEMKK